ncbi:hypothetical protein M9458_010194, partial [Cirrhinus mrigala]
ALPRSSGDCILSSLSVPPSARVTLAAEPLLYHVQSSAVTILSPAALGQLGSDTIIVTDYTEVELSSQEESVELMEKVDADGVEVLLVDQSPAAPAEAAVLFADKPTQGDAASDALTTASHNETQNDNRLQDEDLTEETNQLNPNDERDGADAGSDTSAPQEAKTSVSDVDQKLPQRRGRGRPRKSAGTTDQKILVKTPRRRERPASVKPEKSAEQR